MVTILLEQIIAILTNWFNGFTTWAADMLLKLGLVEEQTEYIDDIYNSVTNIEADTGNIVSSNNNIQTNTTQINNKLSTVSTNVTAISNNVGSISSNVGVTAAYSQDIATNTLNTLDKVITIASDTTQIRSDNSTIKADLDKIYDGIKWSLVNTIISETDESNSPLTFDTDYIDELEQLQLELDYIETGTGTRTPDNPYTYTGVDNLTININGVANTLNLSALVGSTVYSGVLDVLTGTLTIDYYGFTVTGDSGENWTISNTGTQNYYYVYNLPTGSGSAVANSNTANIFPTANIGNNNTNSGCYATSSALRIRWGVEKTVTNWKTWLASHNLTVIYKLITPATYNLTPAIVSAIKGLNSITANNNGKITVTYKESAKHYLDKQEG